MAREKKEKPSKTRRIKQIGEAYQMTRKVDHSIGLWLAGSVLVPFAILLGVGFIIERPVLFGVLGFMVGLTLATVVFGRRAERAAYSQIEGQAGAAAASLNMLRRGWTVTPAVG